MLEEFEERFRDSEYLRIGDFTAVTKAPILVTEYDGDRIVGFAAIENFDNIRKAGVGRLAIGVLPEYQGRGIGKRLIQEVIKQAFNNGKHKIWLTVYTDNERAIRLYESVGFVVEGVFRDEEMTKDGSWRDVYSMALFNRSGTTGIRWGGPDIGAKEVDNILRCVHTDWYTAGPQTAEFERQVAKYTGTKHNIAVGNGTQALITAYSTAFKPGDIVAIPNITFVATLNAAIASQLRPILVNVDANTGLINVDNVERAIKDGHNVRGVVSVALYGMPSDYHSLYCLRDKYGITIVEDAAAALGAEHEQYGDITKVGQGADITIFSLHAAKLITAIEGGVVSTNNDDYAKYARSFINHGSGEEKYRFVQFGLNYRPTDISMGIALAQLGKLDRYIEHRNNIMKIYRGVLGDNRFQMIPPFVHKHTYMACLFFSRDKAGLLDYLKRAGVEVRPSFYELQPLGYGSERLSNNGVLLPMGNKLSDESVLRVAGLVKEFEGG